MRTRILRRSTRKGGISLKAHCFDAYVICTSPRSGSTLLCSLLAATGVAGVPESYFHTASVAEWAAELGIAFDPARPEAEALSEVFRTAIVAGTGGTGLFGLRLQRHSFAFFQEKLAVLHPGFASDLKRFRAAFGHTLFLHLTREDKVAQAVSYVRAQQSGLWHRAPDGSELERLSPPQVPHYDGPAIRTQVAEMTAMDAAWEAWFAGEGISPLRLTYAEIADDPMAVLKKVLARLGRDPAAAERASPGVKKLADDINRAWIRRFRAEPAEDCGES